MALAKQLQSRHPFRARHRQIKQDHVGLVQARGFKAGLRIARMENDEVWYGSAQQRCHTFAHHGMIIYDEYLHGRSLSWWRARVSRTEVLGLPGAVLGPASN